MLYQEIYRRIFDKLISKNRHKELEYHKAATKLADVFSQLNKRELHDVYMVLKAAKR